MKKISIIAALAAALITILVACGGSPNSPATGGGSSSSSTNTVGMGGTSFDMTTITISKGSTITFTMDQGASTHNLVAGSSGQAQTQSGAPTFPSGGEIVKAGDTWTSPPWTTAGTFYVTCTYHPTTMTLKVIVTG